MPTYLLPCSCGKSVPVEPAQAGRQVVCACGQELEVPALRKLRHLSTGEPAPEQVRRKPWNPRKGVMTAALVVSALLGAAALWIWWNEPRVTPFDPVAHMENVEHRLETPTSAWQWWTGYYRPLAERGFPMFQDPHTAAIDYDIARRRFLEGVLLTCAAVALAVALAAYFWPAHSAGRAAARRR